MGKKDAARIDSSARAPALASHLLFTLMLKVAVPISLGEFMGKKDAARIDSSARARALASH